ncbi:MAG: hypothetical protein U0842_12490 [Candidatus Binatia bacterium]
MKRFRQLDSKCPGHPEYRWTFSRDHDRLLGQGVATSVLGMAIAGKVDGVVAQSPRYTMFDYDGTPLCGDGCPMEGISNECGVARGAPASLELCWIYDNNHITIEGHTVPAFSDDVATRFVGLAERSRVGDANDLEDAVARHRRLHGRPATGLTLIIVDSHIGWGAPNKQDTSAAHGEPLGEDEIQAAKRTAGWA